MEGLSAGQLFLTASTPVVQLALLAGVGTLLAYKGTLDAAGCQVLAKICFYVFTPALTFGKLVQAVDFDSIRQLWPLLANMCLSIAVGLPVGWLVAALLRTPRQFRGHVLAAVAFGNVGNLPLVFVKPLCSDRRAVFYRTLGDSCEHLSVAYIAFNIAVATIFQFSIALHLFRRKKLPEPLALPLALEPGSPRGSEGDAAPPPLLASRPTVSDLLAAQSGGQQQQQEQELRHAGGGAATGCGCGGAAAEAQSLELQPRAGSAAGAGSSLAPPPQGATPSPFAGSGPGRGTGRPAGPPETGAVPPEPPQREGSFSAEEPEGEDGDSAWLLGVSRTAQGAPGEPSSGGGSRRNGPAQRAKRSDWGLELRPGRSRLGRWRGAAGRLWRSARSVEWQAVVPLPTQASIAGVTVGCIPPAKALLYGAEPPLRALSGALDTLGQGLIPTTIPMLGAILFKGPGESTLPWRITAGVLITRLVLQPALLTGLVVLALRLRLFASPDPAFLLTMLLSHTTPTAINMGTMTVLYQNYPAEMSTLLFWQYLASLATLPAFIFLFLHIIEVWQPGL